jgi:hypothetical protein
LEKPIGWMRSLLLVFVQVMDLHHLVSLDTIFLMPTGLILILLLLLIILQVAMKLLDT